MSWCAASIALDTETESSCSLSQKTPYIVWYWVGGWGTFILSLLEGVQGQWVWSQMGVHDVRVTVLDLPLVSGVQGEGGMGALQLRKSKNVQACECLM